MSTDGERMPASQTHSQRSREPFFIERLQDLNRGERSVLRRSAGSSLAEAGKAIGLFYRLLPASVHVNDEEIYFLVATLYPWNSHEHRGDFGATMRDLRACSNHSNPGSIDRRMAILLNSDFDQVNGRTGGGSLSYRLRQLVKFADSRQVGIHWVHLLEDLQRWRHPGKWVQKCWARSYYQEYRDDANHSLRPKEETHDAD